VATECALQGEQPRSAIMQLIGSECRLCCLDIRGNQLGEEVDLFAIAEVFYTFNTSLLEFRLFYDMETTAVVTRNLIAIRVQWNQDRAFYRTPASQLALPLGQLQECDQQGLGAGPTAQPQGAPQELPPGPHGQGHGMNAHPGDAPMPPHPPAGGREGSAPLTAPPLCPGGTQYPHPPLHPQKCNGCDRLVCGDPGDAESCHVTYICHNRIVVERWCGLCQGPYALPNCHRPAGLRLAGDGKTPDEPSQELPGRVETSPLPMGTPSTHAVTVPGSDTGIDVGEEGCIAIGQRSSDDWSAACCLCQNLLDRRVSPRCAGTCRGFLCDLTNDACYREQLQMASPDGQSAARHYCLRHHCRLPQEATAWLLRQSPMDLTVCVREARARAAAIAASSTAKPPQVVATTTLESASTLSQRCAGCGTALPKDSWPCSGTCGGQLCPPGPTMALCSGMTVNNSSGDPVLRLCAKPGCETTLQRGRRLAAGSHAGTTPAPPSVPLAQRDRTMGRVNPSPMPQTSTRPPSLLHRSAADQPEGVALASCGPGAVATAPLHQNPDGLLRRREGGSQSYPVHRALPLHPKPNPPTMALVRSEHRAPAKQVVPPPPPPPLLGRAAAQHRSRQTSVSAVAITKPMAAIPEVVHCIACKKLLPLAKRTVTCVDCGHHICPKPAPPCKATKEWREGKPVCGRGSCVRDLIDRVCKVRMAPERPEGGSEPPLASALLGAVMPGTQPDKRPRLEVELPGGPLPPAKTDTVASQGRNTEPSRDAPVHAAAPTGITGATVPAQPLSVAPASEHLSSTPVDAPPDTTVLNKPPKLSTVITAITAPVESDTLTFSVPPAERAEFGSEHSQDEEEPPTSQMEPQPPSMQDATVQPNGTHEETAQLELLRAILLSLPRLTGAQLFAIRQTEPPSTLREQVMAFMRGAWGTLSQLPVGSLPSPGNSSYEQFLRFFHTTTLEGHHLPAILGTRNIAHLPRGDIPAYLFVPARFPHPPYHPRTTWEAAATTARIPGQASQILAGPPAATPLTQPPPPVPPTRGRERSRTDELQTRGERPLRRRTRSPSVPCRDQQGKGERGDKRARRGQTPPRARPRDRGRHPDQDPRLSGRDGPPSGSVRSRTPPAGLAPSHTNSTRRAPTPRPGDVPLSREEWAAKYWHPRRGDQEQHPSGPPTSRPTRRRPRSLTPPSSHRHQSRLPDAVTGQTRAESEARPVMPPTAPEALDGDAVATACPMPTNQLDESPMRQQAPSETRHPDKAAGTTLSTPPARPLIPQASSHLGDDAISTSLTSSLTDWISTHEVLPPQSTVTHGSYTPLAEVSRLAPPAGQLGKPANGVGAPLLSNDATTSVATRARHTTAPSHDAATQSQRTPSGPSPRHHPPLAPSTTQLQSSQAVPTPPTAHELYMQQLPGTGTRKHREYLARLARRAEIAAILPTPAPPTETPAPPRRPAKKRRKQPIRSPNVTLWTPATQLPSAAAPAQQYAHRTTTAAHPQPRRVVRLPAPEPPRADGEDAAELDEEMGPEEDASGPPDEDEDM
jgi:hypothetical protein